MFNNDLWQLKNFKFFLNDLLKIFIPNLFFKSFIKKEEEVFIPLGKKVLFSLFTSISKNDKRKTIFLISFFNKFSIYWSDIS